MIEIVEPRDIYKYHFKVGHRIVHRGITDDLECTEREDKQIWPNGRIVKIGNKTTRDAALRWERRGGKVKRCARQSRSLIR